MNEMLDGILAYIERRTRPCDHCHGIGYSAYTGETCPYCGGSSRETITELQDASEEDYRRQNS